MLNYAESRRHVLSVSAEDCDGKKTQRDLIVVVEVKEKCKAGWKGEINLGKVITFRYINLY